MNRLYRVRDGAIRRVRVTPDGNDKYSLAFVHDSRASAYPVETVVLAGSPDFIRANFDQSDKSLQPKPERDSFMERYFRLASKYDDSVVFVIGSYLFNTQTGHDALFPVIPARISEGRSKPGEYESVNRSIFWYDGETEKLTYSAEKSAPFETASLPFTREDMVIDPKDLFLLTGPEGYRGAGSLMASKAPRTLDIHEIAAINSNEVLNGILRYDIKHFRNFGLPESIGPSHLVRVFGFAIGDSLITYWPIARFGCRKLK